MMTIKKNGKEIVLGQITSFKMPKVNSTVRIVEKKGLPDGKVALSMQVIFDKNANSLIERAKRRIGLMKLQSQLYGWKL